MNTMMIATENEFASKVVTPEVDSLEVKQTTLIAQFTQRKARISQLQVDAVAHSDHVVRNYNRSIVALYPQVCAAYFPNF